MARKRAPVRGDGAPSQDYLDALYTKTTLRFRKAEYALLVDVQHAGPVVDGEPTETLKATILEGLKLLARVRRVEVPDSVGEDGRQKK